MSMSWRHTRRGDKYVTVIIDLTPIRDGTGPSRLLDMARGTLETGVQDLARRPRQGVARPARGGRNGRLHRVQDRHQKVVEALAVTRFTRSRSRRPLSQPQMHWVCSRWALALPLLMTGEKVRDIGVGAGVGLRAQQDAN